MSAQIRIIRTIDKFLSVVTQIPYWLIALVGRIGLGVTFLRSGQTKVDGLTIDTINFSVGFEGFDNLRLADSTLFLFQHEYKLPIIPYDWAAYLATVAEHVLPILLIIGLFTRLSALGLLAMTAVIQIFVYPAAYDTHFTWAIGLMVLMANGAGPVSLDALWRREPKSAI